MSDLISRKAAIDAMEDVDWYHINSNGQLIHGANSKDNEPLYKAKDVYKVLNKMPSAQPDSKETSSTHKALDTISRQAAIEINRSYHGQMPNEVNHRIWKEINELPSAQPETHEERTKTHACDYISRQAAMEEISKQQTYKMFEGEDTLYLDANDVGSVLASLPSAQPEQTNSWCINSWCIDCKEYDTENKCCPRYNRVIKQTLDDAYRHGETEAEARFHAEIIACGDCKHWICHDRRCGYWNHGVRAIDWCSYAERRTDEHDDIFE